jgi:putative Mn2+ efflux pump MntP
METLPSHLRLSWIVAIMLFTFAGMWMIDEFFINVEQEVEYLQDEE